MAPRDLFEHDLLIQIQIWQQQGERILLMMDLNEHILTGRFATKQRSIGLDETTRRNWNGTEPIHT